MPVTGLPIAVEGALNNLLTASHVSSWKLQGNGKSTTLMLKFIDNSEGAMADQNNSSNISYKKKSSGQIRREKLRAEEYFKEKQQKDKFGTDKEQKSETKEETDMDTKRKNRCENSRNRPTSEKREETNLENTLAESTESKGTNVLKVQLDKFSEDNTKRASRPITVSETGEKDKVHQQQGPTQQSFTPSKSVDEAAKRVNQRHFQHQEIENQLKKFSIRMKKMFVDKERNSCFKYVKTYSEDNLEEIFAETDDFLFKYQSDDVKKKIFIVKNSSHWYRSGEEERMMHIFLEPTVPWMETEKRQAEFKEMELDLLVLKDFIRLCLSHYTC